MISNICKSDPVTISTKQYGPVYPLEDRPHHTATLWKIDGLFFNGVWVFVSPVHTIMPINHVIKFKCGFFWPNNCVLKILPLLTLVQEPLTKLQSAVWVVLIYCVEKFWNVGLLFLSLQNSMNTGFLDTNLIRTLSQ